MRFIVVLLLLSFASAAGRAQDAQPRSEDEVVKKLQGTWKIVRQQTNGKEAAPFLLEAMPTVTFEGKNFTWGDGETGKIVKIDASKTPIEIDYQYTSGERRNEIDLAIVRFDGETFTDCMPLRGGNRPNQFNTLQGAGGTLMSYQRTNEVRGRGALLNPWFYIGICATVVVAALIVVVLVIVFIVWMARSGVQEEKPRRRRRSERDWEEED